MRLQGRFPLKARFALVATLLLALSFHSVVSTSPLVAWEQLNPLPQSNDLVRVAFAGDKFVAVGKLGTILTSSDGAEWQVQDSGTERPLGGVAWGNGVYVAVGGSMGGDGLVLTSDDGASWHEIDYKPGKQLSDVTFGPPASLS